MLKMHNGSKVFPATLVAESLVNVFYEVMITIRERQGKRRFRETYG